MFLNLRKNLPKNLICCCTTCLILCKYLPPNLINTFAAITGPVVWAWVSIADSSWEGMPSSWRWTRAPGPELDASHGCCHCWWQSSCGTGKHQYPCYTFSFSSALTLRLFAVTSETAHVPDHMHLLLWTCLTFCRHAHHPVPRYSYIGSYCRKKLSHTRNGSMHALMQTDPF